MRWPVVVLGGVVLACRPPANALTATCESTMLAVGDPFACTVAQGALTQYASVSLTTPSRNHHATVKARLQVARGAARVALHGRDGEVASAVLSPGQPAELTARLELTRPIGGAPHFFLLVAEPLDGGAEQLTGTLDYDTR